MKTLFLFSGIAFLLLVVACRKDSKRISKEEDKLQGKWLISKAKLTSNDGHYYSDVKDSFQYSLEFNDKNVSQYYPNSNASYKGTFFVGSSQLHMHFVDDSGTCIKDILFNDISVTNKQLTVSDYEPNGVYDLTFKKQ